MNYQTYKICSIGYLILSPILLFKRVGGLCERLCLRLPEFSGFLHFHAASVGEFFGLKQTIEALKIDKSQFIVTTNTQTAAAFVKKENFIHSYLPLDVPFILRSFFKRLNIKLVVLSEGELWPNLIHIAKDNGAKVALINATLSRRSFLWYRRLKLFEQTVGQLDLIATESDIVAQRFLKLGAPQEKIKVLGNSKYDIVGGMYDFAGTIRKTRPIWVAGSIHPGEEITIIEAFEKVRKKIGDLLLVLAPRHMKLLPRIMHLLRRKRLSFCKFSEGLSFDVDVVLVDTIGDLVKFYSLADVVFVGGSLVDVGGHNIVEPASLGKPVLFGPYIENYEGVLELLSASGGCVCTRNIREITDKLCYFLGLSEGSAKKISQALQSAVESLRGAAQRNAKAIRELL